MKTWRTTTADADATEALAEKIGKRLKGGEVIELVSDLGGGKTAFVRGLARGFGSQDHVASPTFTISRVYHSGKLTMHHFDFYRLGEPGVVAAELSEVIHDSNAVTVIEWSNIVQQILPDKRLAIQLKLAGETSRELEFSYPTELVYLLSSVIPAAEPGSTNRGNADALDSGSEPGMTRKVG